VSDDPRFLAPVGGYVTNASRAIDPLECVAEDEQAELTARARRREQRRELEAWQRARGQVLAAVDGFRREAGSLGRPARDGLRRIVREVDRLDHALRAGS
jgi:hypothetical protein